MRWPVGRQQRNERALPRSIPPGLNHVVIVRTLIADPVEGTGPGGDPVTLLEIRFPVAHPADQRLLWTYAFYDVEVLGKVGEQDIKSSARRPNVRGGPAQRASDRLGEHGAIVATLVKPGPCPEWNYPSRSDVQRRSPIVSPRTCVAAAGALEYSRKN